jgi:hypothetical protein
VTQQIIVALIVALAALYAVWHWMPNAWRRVLAAKVALGSQRAGLVGEERARQLAASLGKASGCGSCDDCGACSAKTTAPR